MSLKIPRGFSFFGLGGSSIEEKQRRNPSISPSLNLHVDREVCRPGDWISATIEISVPTLSKDDADVDGEGAPVLLVDSLAFEIKGIQKLDPQWFAMPKQQPGSKQRRGEHLFLDSVVPSMVSKVIVSSGSTRTYIVRAELPKVLPPSYRGSTIRYIYYIRSTLCGRWLVLENGHQNRDSTHDLIHQEARVPLQVWVTQQGNNLVSEGTSVATCLQSDIFWKEKDADSEWIRANEITDSFEEGYDSSRDEVSSVSSYNPTKGSLNHAFRSTLSLQSMITRVSNNEAHFPLGERSSTPPYVPISQLSVAEVMDDSDESSMPAHKNFNSSLASHSTTSAEQKFSHSPFSNDPRQFTGGSTESLASEGFIRGRSYNIRIDNQVLLRFSPKNSEATYFFGDTIGGTLTFFHGESDRRCLEVSITLETSETISQNFVHPSRRSAHTITKIQSDHHEVVADLAQTSFLFSIPMDGPMSFSTPYISVQWALRFEFFTTPKHVDLSRYEHPLLIEEREKGDWVLPISVCAPPPRSQAAHARNEKPSTLGNLWIHT